MKNILILLLLIIPLTIYWSRDTEKILLPLGLKDKETIDDARSKLDNLHIKYTMHDESPQNKIFSYHLIDIQNILLKKHKGEVILYFFNNKLYKIAFYTNGYIEALNGKYVYSKKITIKKRYKFLKEEYLVDKSGNILGVFFTNIKIEDKYQHLIY